MPNFLARAAARSSSIESDECGGPIDADCVAAGFVEPMLPNGLDGPVGMLRASDARPLARLALAGPVGADEGAVGVDRVAGGPARVTGGGGVTRPLAGSTVEVPGGCVPGSPGSEPPELEAADAEAFFAALKAQYQLRIKKHLSGKHTLILP